MSRRGIAAIVSAGILLSPVKSLAFFADIGPLLQLVAGQVREIETLRSTLKVAEDQAHMLKALNDGIGRTIAQIQSLQAILDRVQGLDPKAVRSVAELNEYLNRAGAIKRDVETLLGLKISAADQAIGQTAVQAETAYLMGQEMVATGSSLAAESTTASPGRANQITAASSSASMLAQGVELQTLAQIAQLQALSLDLQKTQIEQMVFERRAHQAAFAAGLVSYTRRKPR